LLASFATAMPFWRWFDPLPVLDSWDKAKAADAAATPATAADARAPRKRRWWRRRDRAIAGTSPGVDEGEAATLKGIIDG
jgi:hypothetical protein